MLQSVNNQTQIIATSPNYFKEFPKEVLLTIIFQQLLCIDFMRLRGTCKDFKAIIDEDMSVSNYCIAAKLFLTNVKAVLSKGYLSHREIAQILANNYHDAMNREIFNLIQEFFKSSFLEVSLDDLYQIIPILAPVCPQGVMNLITPYKCGRNFIDLFLKVTKHFFKNDLKKAFCLLGQYLDKPKDIIEILSKIRASEDPFLNGNKESIRENLRVLQEFLKKYDGSIAKEKLDQFLGQKKLGMWQELQIKYNGCGDAEICNSFLDKIASDLITKDLDLAIEFAYSINDRAFKNKYEFLSNLTVAMRVTKFKEATDLILASNLNVNEKVNILRTLLHIQPLPGEWVRSPRKGFIPMNLTPEYFTSIILNFLDTCKITKSSISDTVWSMYKISPECAVQLAAVSYDVDKVILEFAQDIQNLDFEKALSYFEFGARFLLDFLFLDSRVPNIPQNLSQKQYVDIVTKKLCDFEKKGIEIDSRILAKLNSFFTHFAKSPDILEKIRTLKDSNFAEERAYFVVNKLSSISDDLKKELFSKITDYINKKTEPFKEIINNIFPIIVNMNAQDLFLFCTNLDKYHNKWSFDKIIRTFRYNHFHKALELINSLEDKTKRHDFLEKILFDDNSLFIPQYIPKEEFTRIINQYYKENKDWIFSERLIFKLNEAYLLKGWDKEVEEFFDLIDSLFFKPRRKEEYFSCIVKNTYFQH